MPSTLWENGGTLVQNAAGTALVECATCPCAPCTECSGATPNTLYLTTSGLANLGCADCAALNSTPNSYACTKDPANPCTWEYNFDGFGPCEHTRITIALGTGTLAVRFWRSANQSFGWTKLIALPTNCAVLDETMQVAEFDATGGRCSGVNPTARVHAVL